MATTVQSRTAQDGPIPIKVAERRFYSRIIPQTPIFLPVNGVEDSLLLNVSENGLLVSTPSEIKCNLVARLTIPLDGLPKPVRVSVRVVWVSEERKQAGVQLIDLNEHDREQIRKWGAKESLRAAQMNRQVMGLVLEPLPEPEADGTFPEQPSLQHKEISGALANLRSSVRERSTLTLAIVAILALSVGTVCLATVGRSKSGFLGNLFAHSAANRDESSPIAPQSLDVEPGVPDVEVAQLNTSNPAALPTSGLSVTKSAPSLAIKHSLSSDNSTGRRSAKTEAVTGDDSYIEDPALDTAQARADDVQLGSAPNVGTETQNNAGRAADGSIYADKNAPGGSSRASDTGAVPRDARIANSSRPVLPAPNAVPTPAAPSIATTPLNSMAKADVGISKSSATPPAPVAPSPVVAAARAPGIAVQTGPPVPQVFEVHLPAGARSGFFSLPGERDLVTPSATIHVERFVYMPAAHWLFKRNRRVFVGGLVARLDPQPVQLQAGAANLVRVNASVASDGHIESVRLVQGPPNLVAAVTKAIHEWRYQPTLIDGKPVETQCKIVVQFRRLATTTRAAKQ